jgi:hypothetical protein
MKNQKRRSLGVKVVAVLMIAFLAAPREAKADHPIAVALIEAGAVLGAAAIGAGATVAVAVIGAGVVVATSGDGDKKEESGGTKIAPGTGGKEQRRMGEADLPAMVREFVDRDITLTAYSLPSSRQRGDHEVKGSADYRFDGDILKSKPGTAMFNVKDKLIFRFDIANVARAEDAPFVVKVNSLKLATANIARTMGFSRMRFTVLQDGNVLSTWSAQVNQGELPKIAGSEPAVSRRANDLLEIPNLEVPVNYKAPGIGGKTVVDVVVDLEGQGART